MIFEPEMPQDLAGDTPGIGETGSLTRGAATAGKRTLAEELRLQLADDIVRGALEPGSSLDESELARRFNVSRTPVREALRQLVASGLVNSRAHRGAVVARPTIEQLNSMFEEIGRAHV